VRVGEIFVVMGLSGSGKSTLVRCLIRLIESTRGRIRFDGEDILEYTPEQLIEFRRQEVAMVFQNYGLLPHRSVMDNVAYGLEIQGIDRPERHRLASEAIETVGLGGWEDYYPREMSGGMQQRVGLARALAVNSPVLLMDEPFSGLDPLIRREMQDELITLQTNLHKTIVFITHDLDEALKLGDRIVILHDGEVAQEGSPQEIVTDPADDYVAEFVKDVSRAKVIQAGSIMRPALSASGEYQVTVGPDAYIEEIIPLAARTESPIAVVDKEGRLLGEVHRGALLAGMTESSEEA
jgi:glycine betaine/proline transport system ATP-binding protein